MVLNKLNSTDKLIRINKPAAQAEGGDPNQLHSTNRQNSQIQKITLTFEL